MNIYQFFTCLLFGAACGVIGWWLGGVAIAKIWTKLLVIHLKKKGFNRFYIEQFLQELKKLNEDKAWKEDQ